jgi:hypothetical protein
MDIKPPISQGPMISPDQTDIDAAHDKKTSEPPANPTTENVQTSANTSQAMKQAGTEKKRTMKTG